MGQRDDIRKKRGCGRGQSLMEEAWHIAAWRHEGKTRGGTAPEILKRQKNIKQERKVGAVNCQCLHLPWHMCTLSLLLPPSSTTEHICGAHTPSCFNCMNIYYAQHSYILFFSVIYCTHTHVIYYLWKHEHKKMRPLHKWEKGKRKGNTVAHRKYKWQEMNTAPCLVTKIRVIVIITTKEWVGRGREKQGQKMHWKMYKNTAIIY